MRWSRGFAVGVALLVALSTLGSAAHAQRRPRRDPAREEALQLFQQSEVEYQAGRFTQAAALLERAWGRFHEPILLYNLGRAWEGAGEPEKALGAYRQYLENTPGAADRRTVEAKLAELQRQIETRREAEHRQSEEDERARRQSAEDERREDEEERAERERRRLRAEGGSGPGIAPWILVGGGGLALGAGGVFGLLASSRHDDAQHDPVQQSAADKQDGAETLATVANISFIAGAVMAAGGLTWVLLGGQKDGDDAEGEQEQDDRFEDVRAPSLRIAFGPGSVMLLGRLP